MKKINNKTLKPKNSKRLVITWVFIGVSIVGTVFLTIQTATTGARLAKLEGERNKLTNENQKLSSELMIKTSLTNIGKKADGLGFIKPEKTVFMKGQQSVAGLNGSRLE